MAKTSDPFDESWKSVFSNKNLFYPNVITLGINIVFLLGLLFLTGAGQALIDNNLSLFKEVVFSISFLSFVGVFFVLTLLIDNFFLTAKYGMIKDVILKRKTTLHKGFAFAKKYYWTTLKIHILCGLIILIPLALIVVLFFVLLPLSPIIAISILLALGIAYLVFISIRLLFVYPVMTFESKGAYDSLKEDFHYVKTHMGHSIVTWLVVIAVLIIASVIKDNLHYLNKIFLGHLFSLGLIVLALIVGIELIVSVWEHVYIFREYLEGKKSKHKRLVKKTTKKKPVRKKPSSKKVIKRKVVKKKKR